MNVDRIRASQADCVAATRIELAITNSLIAMTRLKLGWAGEPDEAKRKAINASARSIVQEILDDDEPAERDATPLELFIRAAKPAIDAYAKIRRDREADMKALAEQLPAWPWVKAIRGLGAKGLAIIVGEAGDLSNYRGPAKLWKRLGLAPPAAYEMTTKRGDTARVIPRRRRSAIWTIGDSLLKGNRGGSYKKLYDETKARELEKGITKMHAHRRAQRVMEKRLIKDLWRAWRDAQATKAA